MTANRSWLLAGSNAGEGVTGMSLSRENFVQGQLSLPKAGNGELLIKSLYFATDPMNHAWARGVPGRFDAISEGSPLRGGVAGEVIESNHPNWSVGDIVTGFLPWSDFNTSNGTDLLGMPLYTVPKNIDAASGLGALGMTGICAALSLTDYGRPLPGETVVVSGASGAIGSLCCQIAKQFNAHVIGLARAAEKCAYVASLGVDRVVDISETDWPASLQQAAPNGVNVFIDNVGGDILDGLLVQMQRGGRIVICGATAHYEAGASISNHLMLAISGLTMSGFFYFDLAHRWDEMRKHLQGWLTDGVLSDTLDITEGFENVPDAALGQFKRANFGRKLIKVN